MTRCESITNDGKTCINPHIKYGESPIGLPREHRNNQYDKWCSQLGGIYESHEIGTRTGQSLYGCSHSDDSRWHWCDWQDSHWHNGTLDHSRTTSSTFITSVTCQGEIENTITSLDQRCENIVGLYHKIDNITSSLQDVNQDSKGK